MKKDIAIYHGDEQWALKGLGVDFEKAFQSLGLSTVRTDKVFQGIMPLDAHYHFFVQQGQLFTFATNTNLIPKNTICLFTHHNAQFYKYVKLLNSIRGVIFFSQQQEALALSNGMKEGISTSIIMAADPKKHCILKSENVNKTLLENNKVKPKRQYVGFCLRYWERDTYQARKSYKKIIEIINTLSEAGIPCIILGPGWKHAKDVSEKVKKIETDYENYEQIYNIMRVFVSLSINEGGPLPLLESMMCGATPVATTTGFSTELLINICPQNLLPCMTTNEEAVRKIISKYYDNIAPEYASKHAQQYSFINAAKTIAIKYLK